LSNLGNLSSVLFSIDLNSSGQISTDSTTFYGEVHGLDASAVISYFFQIIFIIEWLYREMIQELYSFFFQGIPN